MEDSTSSTLSLSIGGSLSAVVLGIVGYCFWKTKPNNDYAEIEDSRHEIQKYNQMADEIYTERSFIVNRIKVIDEKLDRDLQ